MLAVAFHIKFTELVIFSWQLVTVNYKFPDLQQWWKDSRYELPIRDELCRDIHVYASMSDQ